MSETAVAPPTDLAALITRLQATYLRGTEAHRVFDAVLPDLLAITGSEYGYIGEVWHDDDGRPYLKVFTLTDIAWDGATRALLRARRDEGMEFRNLNSLFGAAVRTGEPVIANQPATDPRRGGLPPGHPPLNAFAGVPLVQGGVMVGQVGLANRPGGYDAALLESLQPLFATVALIMSQVQTDRERRRAEEALRRSEALYRTTFESAGVGIAHVDLQGRYLEVNAHQCAILGRSAEELRGLRFQDITHPDDLDADLAQMQRLLLGGCTRYEMEKRFVRPDGSVVWTLLTVALLRDGDGAPQLILSTLQDVGERKQLEQARVAAEAALRANRAKTEFLSRMSHELRTPLNAVLGFAQLLRMDAREPMTPRQLEQVQHIEQAGRHLLGMIDEVLDLSRIEQGAMALHLVPVSVHGAVQEAIAMLQPAAAVAGVTMSLDGADGSPAVQADEQRLRQVLVNLLSNAVKYNHPGGRVRVDWQVAGEGRVRIDVIDTGIGLTGRQRKHLFEPFNRLGAERSRVEGAGIGLVITQRLLQAMDGRLQVHSEPGQGSTFSVLLPLAGPAAAPPRRPS